MLPSYSCSFYTDLIYDYLRSPLLHLFMIFLYFPSLILPLEWSFIASLKRISYCASVISSPMKELQIEFRIYICRLNWRAYALNWRMFTFTHFFSKQYFLQLLYARYCARYFFDFVDILMIFLKNNLKNSPYYSI